jgi:hypothetical protein
MTQGQRGVDPSVPPSGTGSLECLASDGWWVHLRRCAQCGHVGCCDTSPSQHATGHAHATQHPLVQSFEPGGVLRLRRRRFRLRPALEPPTSRPESQLTRLPGRVPANWQDLIHDMESIDATLTDTSLVSGHLPTPALRTGRTNIVSGGGRCRQPRRLPVIVIEAAHECGYHDVPVMQARASRPAHALGLLRQPLRR